MGLQRLTHGFGPFFDEDSEVLVLGSFPSVKSREQQFYYGHPQNRFWRLMTILYECGGDIRRVSEQSVPKTKVEKQAFAKKHHIALWDVIASCDIEGSADSSIRNAEVNDLSKIIPKTSVRKILVNGGTACKLFEKQMMPQAIELGIPMENCMKMPSTSPANAQWSMQRLLEAWGEALNEVVMGEQHCCS